MAVVRDRRKEGMECCCLMDTEFQFHKMKRALEMAGNDDSLL